MVTTTMTSAIETPVTTSTIEEMIIQAKVRYGESIN